MTNDLSEKRTANKDSECPRCGELFMNLPRHLRHGDCAEGEA